MNAKWVDDSIMQCYIHKFFIETIFGCFSHGNSEYISIFIKMCTELEKNDPLSWFQPLESLNHVIVTNGHDMKKKP